jgi:hypothetical protein
MAGYCSIYPKLNPSFRCDNTVSGIRLDGNIFPFFTFRFDGIRFDGSESLKATFTIQRLIKQEFYLQFTWRFRHSGLPFLNVRFPFSLR